MDTHMQDLQKLMLPVKLWDCLTYGLINKFPKQVSEEWLGNAWCKKIPPEGSAAWFVPRPPKMQKHQRGDLLADAVCPGEEVPPLSGPAEYLLMLLQSSFPTDRCKLLIKKVQQLRSSWKCPTTHLTPITAGKCHLFSWRVEMVQQEESWLGCYSLPVAFSTPFLARSTASPHPACTKGLFLKYLGFLGAITNSAVSSKTEALPSQVFQTAATTYQHGALMFGYHLPQSWMGFNLSS